MKKALENTKAKYIKISPSQYKKLLLSDWRTKLDKFIVILGIVNVAATVPQITQIWSTRDGSGVSILTWTYYVFFTAVLLAYAIAIKSKPMTLMYTGNTIVYTIVLVSAAIFR